MQCVPNVHTFTYVWICCVGYSIGLFRYDYSIGCTRSFTVILVGCTKKPNQSNTHEMKKTFIRNVRLCCRMHLYVERIKRRDVEKVHHEHYIHTKCPVPCTRDFHTLPVVHIKFRNNNVIHNTTCDARIIVHQVHILHPYIIMISHRKIVRCTHTLKNRKLPSRRSIPIMHDVGCCSRTYKCDTFVYHRWVSDGRP